MDTKSPHRPASPSSAVGNSQIDPTVLAILDRLDEQDEENAQNKRKEVRLPYRRAGLRLCVTHPGGGTAEREVIGRNLSLQGAAVLYDGFLHPGTKCQLVLSKRVGGQEQIRGRLRYCRHIQGAYHLIGLEFDDPIAPKLYVDPSVWASVAKEITINPSSLGGSLLVIDDLPMNLAVLTRYLQATAVKVTGANTGAEALTASRASRFDAIVTELNFDNGERGEQIIVRIRETGFRGPIIVTSAENNTERIAAAWAAGASAVLAKPFTRERLFSTLASVLSRSGGSDSDELLHSSLFEEQNEKDQPGTASFVATYIDHVKELLADFERAMKEDDLDRVRKICLTFKGNAASYGFPRVSELAEKAITALDSSGSIDEAMHELRQFEVTCMRMSRAPDSTKRP